MVSSLFTQYECDFVHLLKAIEDRTAVLSAPTSTSADKRKNLAKGLKELNEAEACLKQMEMEIRMNALAIEDAGTAEKVAFHSSNFRNAQTSFFSRKAEVERQLLLDRTGSEAAAALEASQAARLLSTSASLQQGTQRVEEAQRLALESEDLGVQITGSLGSHREIIMRTRSNVALLSENLSTSSRILGGMVGDQPPSSFTRPESSACRPCPPRSLAPILGPSMPLLPSCRGSALRPRSSLRATWPLAVFHCPLAVVFRCLNLQARRAARHRLVLYGVLASVAAVVAFLILRMVLPWLKLWR
eukprot:GHVT01038894.1.p1 GENE.GHVT01038894.1~~GHVT01038894.1.p1  ORF type:complete len:302 (+),score=60.51 GHVT01038894.1:1585-2490(+)